MILCSKCKRVWPQETKWCGNCRATLGVRACSEGHESPLDAKVCTTCGSTKLSPGVTSVNLRVATWLLIGLILILVVPPAFQITWSTLGRVLSYFLDRALTLIVGLAFLSFVFWPLLSEAWKRELADFWLRLFNLAIQLILLATRATARFLRK